MQKKQFDRIMTYLFTGFIGLGLGYAWAYFHFHKGF